MPSCSTASLITRSFTLWYQPHAEHTEHAESAEQVTRGLRNRLLKAEDGASASVQGLLIHGQSEATVRALNCDPTGGEAEVRWLHQVDAAAPDVGVVYVDDVIPDLDGQVPNDAVAPQAYSKASAH